MAIDYLKPVKTLAGAIMGRGPKVSPLTAEIRLKKCLACQHIIDKTKQCKFCLCFVEEKVKYEQEHCKIGR